MRAAIPTAIIFYSMSANLTTIAGIQYEPVNSITHTVAIAVIQCQCWQAIAVIQPQRANENIHIKIYDLILQDEYGT
tara:strand:+ start:902 stop:1132 length:231 start_codon:yes stop_codon:yes gene_type:complete